MAGARQAARACEAPEPTIGKEDRRMPETTHPPAGEYPRSAPVHHLDLEVAASQLLSELPGKRRRTRNLARESGVSAMLMALEAGDVVKEHSAEGVVTIQLLRGHVFVSMGSESLELRQEQLLMFQPGIRHDLRAEEQSVLLLTITGGR